MGYSDKPEWRPLDHLRSMVDVVKVLGAEALSAIDRKFADNINPPEEQEFPRYYPQHIERPVETEEELDGQDKLW